MTIVIKEIEVKTIVEKKIIEESDISNSLYEKIISDVVLELNRHKPKQQPVNKRER